MDVEERLIELIFGLFPPRLLENGSDGVDDDPFAVWASPEEAELYA